MNRTDPSIDFYASVVPRDDFASFSNADGYTPLPDQWWVGTSDIIGSTQAIAEGRYKTVNMVGAAVISAQMNAHGGAAFPFIFGGDGAGFAVPPAWKDRAEQALAAVQLWACDAFDMGLRIGMVRVRDIRAAGYEISVARYQAAKGLDYAMFAGGGLSWAETQMKTGAYGLPKAPTGTRPDLTGLSCRWSHMSSQNGTILSLVILPRRGVLAADFARLAREVVALAQGLERAGHPIGHKGPGIKWPPAGATLEAHAQRGTGSLGKARRKALYESFVGWVLIKTGLKLAGFDGRRYRKMISQHADFRKFDDGLKMTLDCDDATEDKLRRLLEQAEADGIIRFGLHGQSEAMMTCIVPSIQTDDHIHFVDGAAGGYTAAAQAIKAGMG